MGVVECGEIVVEGDVVDVVCGGEFEFYGEWFVVVDGVVFVDVECVEEKFFVVG